MDCDALIKNDITASDQKTRRRHFSKNKIIQPLLKLLSKGENKTKEVITKKFLLALLFLFCAAGPNLAQSKKALGAYNRGYDFQAARRLDEAIAEYDKVIQMSPNFAMGFCKAHSLY
jgi:hypothetical protein